MNSVALPVSAAGSVLSAEADLARLAGRGDEEAFGELFRGHGQTAWRLAQAVTTSRDAAIRAVGDGFARAVRYRGHRGTSQAFRPAVLAAVYRSAIDQIRHDGTSPTPAPPVAPPRGRSKARSADLALAESAFRSLPERWRAALWLAEVEAMSLDGVAAVLGVSGAVASQLVVRGQRGLAGRYSQAHRSLPEHIGPVLRPLGAAVPTSLAAETAARWRASFDLPIDRLAPVAAWLTDRAERPLQIATAGLIALGLVGLGILGEGAATHTGPAAIRGSGADGSVGVNGSGQTFLLNGTETASAELAADAIPGLTSGFQAAAAEAAAAAAAAAGLGGGGSSSNPGSGNPGSSSTTLPRTGNQNPGSGSSPNPGQTLLAVPGLTQIQTGNNGTDIQLLPNGGGGSAAEIIVGCKTGVGIRIGDMNIGCGSSSSSSTSTTTTLPLPTTTLPLPTTIPTVPTTLPITIPSIPTTLPITIPSIPTTIPGL